MTDLLSLSQEELADELKKLGQPAFRAKQITEWLLRGCRDFSAMNNLPLSLRKQLADSYLLHEPVLLREQCSREDGTRKYLWGLQDGNSVETVLMHYHYGNSVCISSQVGCRQGCAFCASTIGGLVRCLSAGEMLDEVLYTEIQSGERISNIVLMGIGEPLDNFQNVLRFLRLIHSEDGRNIGLRHITISTCGLPEGMAALAKEKFPVTLSVSLHAPDDETRSKIMPSNRGVDIVMEACKNYIEATGRRISFEYAMIAGVNDSSCQAELLAKLAKKIGAHVNMIPLNHVEERSLQPSSPAVMRHFQEILEQKGVNVTIRRRLGSDIDASCGQLRRKFLSNNQ
ncbi:MAG: 23S rRNA (adenine(2503)-C(2))-methyltransferase RlmN [Oscillospiraceae bacterium]|nr:23S rRNA (adenine(2503)-C(2))-methyltransferase RlmN [Oscillospiraceae bacterium]